MPVRDFVCEEQESKNVDSGVMFVSDRQVRRVSLIKRNSNSKWTQRTYWPKEEKNGGIRLNLSMGRGPASPIINRYHCPTLLHLLETSVDLTSHLGTLPLGNVSSFAPYGVVVHVIETVYSVRTFWTFCYVGVVTLCSNIMFHTDQGACFASSISIFSFTLTFTFIFVYEPWRSYSHTKAGWSWLSAHCHCVYIVIVLHMGVQPMLHRVRTCEVSPNIFYSVVWLVHRC